jgi:hypothetical protein
MPPTPKKGSIIGSVKAGYKALTAAAAYTDKLKKERIAAAAKAKAKAAGKLIEGAALNKKNYPIGESAAKPIKSYTYKDPLKNKKLGGVVKSKKK